VAVAPVFPQNEMEHSVTTSGDALQSIAYDAYVYAYPMLEQVKTINNMIRVSGMEFNRAVFNPKLPWDNVGMPIVAPNLTSMTGVVLLDMSHGPVTVEIPEVTDRYIVYQCIDGFTYNFSYMGSRADGGRVGRYVFHRPGQEVGTGATPVEVETDHGLIVVRIDITDATELPRLRDVMDGIRVVDAPDETRPYPTYDPEWASGPEFVGYINELLSGVPASESGLFRRFASIGLLSDTVLTDEEKGEVQAGIDAALADIAEQAATATALGNGWVGATTLFGTREYLDGNYMSRAIGAFFGLWGNSKEEANYFLGFFEGDGDLHFGPDELPPLSDIGFWSLTIHDPDMLVRPNEFDSYVITMDQMEPDDDGGMTFRFSSHPDDGNWLYIPGERYAVLLRAYQADPSRIGDYVPPAFTRR
jgi:hypothetical protein